MPEPTKKTGNPRREAGKKRAKSYRRYKTASAAKVASSLLSPAIRAKGFAQAEVVSRWSQIVGPELAAVTVPQRLIFPRGERMDAKLVIRCESAFATLLDHKAPHIIDMVNRFFGFGAVAKIEIKQGPLKTGKRLPAKEKKPLSASEGKKLDTLVGTGELSPLQEAVKSLGEMVLSNSDKKK